MKALTLYTRCCTRLSIMLVVLVLSSDDFKRRDLNSNCLGFEWFRMRKLAAKNSRLRALSLSLFLSLSFSRSAGSSHLSWSIDCALLISLVRLEWMIRLYHRFVLNAFRLSPQVVNKQLRADYEQSKAESAADRRSQSETKRSRSVAGTALCGHRPPTKKST